MGHIELFFGFSLALFGIAFTVITILVAHNERTKIGASGVGIILVATGFFIGQGGLDVASTPMAPSIATFMFIAIFGGLALVMASLMPSRRRKKDEVN